MSYKFNYFNARGLGETCRLIFVAADQDFQDVRFSRDEWPEQKLRSPTGQAPFLETPEGTILVQSRAIQRYLGNKFGLYGESVEDKYRIDVVSEVLTDIVALLGAIIFATDEESKKSLAEDLFSTKGPVLLNALSKFLSEGQPGAIVGGKLSWADLEVFAVSEYFEGKPESKAFLETFPVVIAHVKAVKELPKIAAYLAQRPVTEY